MQPGMGEHVSGQASVGAASTRRLTKVSPGSSSIHLISWPQASQDAVQVTLQTRHHKPGMHQAPRRNGSTPQGRPQPRPPTSPTPVGSQVSCCVEAVPGGGSRGAAGLRGEATASPAGWLVWARGSVRLPVLCFSADLLVDLRRSRSESVRTSHARTKPAELRTSLSHRLQCAGDAAVGDPSEALPVLDVLIWDTVLGCVWSVAGWQGDRGCSPGRRCRGWIQAFGCSFAVRRSDRLGRPLRSLPAGLLHGQGYRFRDRFLGG